MAELGLESMLQTNSLSPQVCQYALATYSHDRHRIVIPLLTTRVPFFEIMFAIEQMEKYHFSPFREEV